MKFSERMEYERARLCLPQVSELGAKELYTLVSNAAMAEIADRWRECTEQKQTARCAYYLSAEFLMGRAVYNNLANLKLTDEAENYLAKFGKHLSDMEEVEDAALGNGGLGRLAACFLDSAATCGINLDGYGIRYRYGLFKQSFDGGAQCESADDWTKWGDPWSVRCERDAVRVKLGNLTVNAVPYDTPVIGYGGKINTLRLWQSEPVSGFDFTKFDRGDYVGAYKQRLEAERISAVLYPNDNTLKGKKLRLNQEYFFAAASVADIVRKLKRNGLPLEKIGEYAAVQLNDTHPVIAVPELIRVLMKEGLGFGAAYKAAKETFFYTNHTVMAEALETWDCKLIRALSPAVYAVIKKLDETASKEIADLGGNADKTRIICGERVHMARLAVFMSGKTNGVAKIHTEILKRDTLREFYKVYPDRFHNKTNGITPRRWLYLCNPALSGFITERIGDGWICNADELIKLAPYCDDRQSLDEFRNIKRQNKIRLSDEIERREGIKLNPDFIFDIQVKRLHEYKRQLMNALGIVSIYRGIKSGKIKNFTPTAFIFGAKSAPGYRRAKGIIRYINEVAKLINADPDMHELMKVVFVSDYNVSYAEKLMPAGDVSEQISAAGTEASGTGNMKLMLNGAVTLGTYDGANIEIAQAAGEDNNYIFGARVEELDAVRGSYDPRKLYESDPVLRDALDTLIDGTFSDGDSGIFAELYDSLLVGASYHRPDCYFVLYDFEAYNAARLRVNADYLRPDFVRKQMQNTAHAGGFSSDRTIKEYASDTWKVRADIHPEIRR